MEERDTIDLERRLISARLIRYLNGCFPDAHSDSYGPVDTLLWLSGGAKLATLRTSKNNINVIYGLGAHGAPAWHKIFNRMRSPSLFVPLKDDDEVLRKELKKVCGNQRFDNFSQQADYRHWFLARLVRGDASKLFELFTTSIGNQLRLGPGGDTLPNHNVGVDFRSFSFRESLEPSWRASSEAYTQIAESCIASYIVPGEVISKDSLRVGLRRFPYLLKRGTAELVVKIGIEIGFLTEYGTRSVHLADFHTNLWSRDLVADCLGRLASRLNPERAIELRAIAHSFRSDASLNDYLGWIVPSWCVATVSQIPPAQKCSRTRDLESRVYQLVHVLESAARNSERLGKEYQGGSSIGYPHDVKVEVAEASVGALRGHVNDKVLRECERLIPKQGGDWSKFQKRLSREQAVLFSGCAKPPEPKFGKDKSFESRFIREMHKLAEWCKSHPKYPEAAAHIRVSSMETAMYGRAGSKKDPFNTTRINATAEKYRWDYELSRRGDIFFFDGVRSILTPPADEA